ncbi:MAG: 3-(3-hydroxy-phenyl)propionate hydroxylase, partial [Mycobacterium sp.]|nr:3-(3-hydroxy-phenyl)propionate hydroxylase [Mycobacterium sp.]
MSDQAVRRVPVVIVGAGPTGVTTATLLARYGIDSLLLDRWNGVYAQPRAVHMDDEVYRIFARIGIADQIAAISRPCLGLRLVDKNMTELAEFSRDTALSSNGFPQANMFDQPDLEAVLRANLAHFPEVELRGDAEVTGVVDGGAGPIHVTYRDRLDGTEHVVETDYVLGCDGANSLVRASMGSTMRDMRFEQRWLVVDVATATDLHQWEGVHQVCNPDRAGTYMRIGDTRYRWEFRLLPDETVADFDTIATLRPLIAPWVTGIRDADLELVRVTEYTFRAQLADDWRRGNVFLLGDAAHLTPPFIGQGMGAGIRDAANLSWKLAGVLNGDLVHGVLDTYQRERKPHARSMIRLALGVGRSMTSGGEVGNLIRSVVVPRLHLIPGMRDKIVDSTTPALHRSDMVLRPRRPRQLAGTLCPNPLLASG